MEKVRIADMKLDYGMVSVIVPLYNSEQFIADTLRSISFQTYSDIEVIIVDDASTDASCEIVRQFIKEDSRFKLVLVENNTGGPAGPRNIGLSYASGQYVAFMDSDDIWHPSKLEIQLFYMLNNGVEFISTRMQDFVDSATLVYPIFNSINVQYVRFNKLLKKDIIPTSSVLIKRSIIEGMSFNENPDFVAVEDYDLWLKIHERLPEMKSIKILAPLMYYRVSSGSISSSKVKMIKKVYNLLRQYRFIDGGRIGYLQIYCYMFTYMFYSVRRIVLSEL